MCIGQWELEQDLGLTKITASLETRVKYHDQFSQNSILFYWMNNYSEN